MDKIYEARERTPLQRCHIVPRSLSGGTDPSNFFCYVYRVPRLGS